MTITRRDLGSWLALGAANVLVACTAIENAINGAGTVNTQALQTLLANVQSVDKGLTAAMTLLTKDPALKVSAAVAASINAALSAVENAAASLSGATDVKAQPTVNAVRAFATAVNALVQAAAAIPIIPPPYSTALEAAAVLLPIIEATVGLAGDVAPAGSVMHPDTAKLILDGLATEAK